MRGTPKTLAFLGTPTRPYEGSVGAEVVGAGFNPPLRMIGLYRDF
jgi:hypothetical protein